MDKFLPVLQRHGVPYVSPLHGLAPYDTQEKKDWMAANWFHDFIHPTLLGHSVIGTTVADFVSLLHDDLRLTRRAEAEANNNNNNDAAAPKPDNYYSPKPPVFVQQDRLDMYIDGRKLELLVGGDSMDYWVDVLKMRNASSCRHWSIFADAPGKPGLIADEVGSTCDLFVTAAEVKAFRCLQSLHVLMLKSYAHMGVLGISLSSSPARPDGTCPPTSSSNSNSSSSSSTFMRAVDRTTLGFAKVNTSWDVAASTPLKAELPITMPAAAATTTSRGRASSAAGHYCLYVSLTVLYSNRTENKVKVVSLALHGM